jgi:hypothetical protein
MIVYRVIQLSLSFIKLLNSVYNRILLKRLFNPVSSIVLICIYYMYQLSISKIALG